MNRKTTAIYVDVDLHQAFKAKLKADGYGLSYGYEQLMSAYLERSADRKAVATPQSRTSRISLYVTKKVREVLEEQSSKFGLRLGTYCQSVLYAHTKDLPVVAKEESEAVLEAVTALGAVGRNLNTALHRLYRDSRWDYSKAEIEELRDAVERLDGAFRDLLQRVTKRGQGING
jgi:hypothetical protein